MLELMAKALGMDTIDMRVMFEEGHQGMRMNYYPPCPEPKLAISLNSHSDAAGLTILLEINEMECLQIRKNGLWIPVKPFPNAFCDQHWRHFGVKERVSIATFYLSKLDGDMGPAASLITPQTPAMKRIGFVDYLKRFFVLRAPWKIVCGCLEDSKSRKH
ncbi:hypothetical protein DITRI_Ditri10aG0171400 [Diplodiscus trichospermus]